MRLRTTFWFLWTAAEDQQPRWLRKRAERHMGLTAKEAAGAHGSRPGDRDGPAVNGVRT